jgi:gliding motility-associated lipoprotein gldH|nr:gliding motility lipoprotein GldH [uncultured Prevotella sp.]
MKFKGCNLLCFIAFIAFIINAISCNDPRIYDKYQNVSLQGWNRRDTLTFDIPRQWEGRYLLFLGIRTAKNFPYRNLSVIVNEQIISVKGRKRTIRYSNCNIIRCKIVNKKGQIIGHENISNNTIRSYIKSFYLKRNDSIHITINHNMNEDVLQGVSNIGITLIKQ